MKSRLFFNFFFCLIAAFSFMACEGEVGPQGPAGADGINGAENCTDCHGSSQVITANLWQWENSVHATGGNYSRNYGSCAGCHTSQGFLELLETGEIAADISNPLPQNCYTCHKIHNTYTGDDWALTSNEPVTFMLGGETVDLGKGNQCINCHQARVRTPDLSTVTDNEVYTLTDKRYGPHHGAQGMAFTGNGAYEIGEGYSNSLHTTLVPDACITCHMAPVSGGNEAGGHTFRVSSADGDINMNGCVTCHDDSDVLEGLITATQEDVQSLLDELATKLNEAGILDDNFTYAVVPQDLTGIQLGALYNYQYVKEDSSLGVHNYQYVKTLLENSIAAL